MTVWHLEVARVRVLGAGTHGLGAGELRALVEVAVRDALESTTLPHGRAVRASVRVDAPSLTTGVAIANAVASGVARAVGGRRHG
jgi:hypothetical protein